MALGIFTFVVVAMMGMLPIGLERLSESADRVAVARITAQVSDRVRAGMLGTNEALTFDRDGSPTAADPAFRAVCASASPLPGGTNTFELVSTVWEIFRNGSTNSIRGFQVSRTP